MHAIAPLDSGSGAVMWWASAVLAPPSDLGVDRGAARAVAWPSSSSTRAAAALADHEPVARDVEGARDADPGQRGHVAEAGDGDVRHRVLAAPGEHHVAAPERDQPRGVRHRVGARGAGRRHRLARAAQARSAARPPAAPAFGMSIGTKKGETRSRPAVVEHGQLVDHRRDPADAGREERARTRRVGDLEVAGVLERLQRRGQGVLGEPVEPARVLRAEERVGLEARGRSSTPGATPSQSVLNSTSAPEPAAVIAPDARDDDTPARDGRPRAGRREHQSLELTRSKA